MRDGEICAAASTLHDSVLAGAAARGAGVAVIDSATGRQHSYAELARDAGRLAGAVWRATAPAGAAAGYAGHTGKLIAVLCEKGYHQALATLAIMQAAHGYLPLHVDWPARRLLDVMAEGAVDCVLISRLCAADAALVAALSARHRVLVIEDLLDAAGAKAQAQTEAEAEAEAALPAVGPDDIAYVIFTSGSTGKPKGVTISHRGALNTIIAVNGRYAVGAGDRVLALSELSFDLSVYDIFGLLMAGGTVVFPDQRHTKDAAGWRDLVERHHITLWNTVPQLAGLLAGEYQQRASQGKSLRLFLLSGDKIPLALPAQLRQSCPQAVTVSLGGATEGSIWSIWCQIDTVRAEWRAIPYGYAMPNQLMLVLDEDGKPCAPGAAGEIHIGGMGVALNYWNDPDKTAASFIEHPQWGRLYRTGDLGALNPEQYIEFIGRKDRQVKIRGYRVELGEIEAQLAACAGVKDCAVADLLSLRAQQGQADHGGRQLLLAYYVAGEHADGAADAALEVQLLARLRAVLPDYMVPDRYIAIARMPLTANGKVDYKALPLPAQPEHGQGVAAPATAREQAVAAIWTHVLGLGDGAVGIDDDFVHSGGDSIDAIRLASRLRQGLACQVGVADIFAARTIRALCRAIEASDGEPATAVQTESGTLTGAARLLPVQQWFFQQRFEQPAQWSQAFFIHTPALDTARLQACLGQLFAHHDAFRLRFVVDGAGAAHQRYSQDAAPRLAVHGDGAAGDHARRLRHAQRRFDLGAGPLCGIDYISGYPDGSARICLLVHHLLIDTVSWRILAEDLERLYHGAALGPKGSSYRQWSEAIEAYAAANAGQAAYWQTQLAASRDRFVAFDEPRSDPERAEFSLTVAETAHLLHKANEVHHTEINDLLLAALAAALAASSGHRANAIMLEGHGREDIDPSIDISRTMGWFTALFPLELRAGANVGATIVNVKEALRAVPDKGIGFGALLGYEHPALPAICFNYLGQLDKQGGADAAGTQWYLGQESIVLLSGESNRDGYRLVVTGAVLQGRMRFSIDSYAGAALAGEVAAGLQQCLAELVRYTGEQTRSYLSAHDVGHLLTQVQLDELQAGAEVEQVFLANSLQQGFIYHALSQGDTDTAYHVQTVWEYHSAIDEDKLRQAWQTAQRMYGALRMRFCWQDKLLQIIDRRAPLEWESLELGALDRAAQQARMAALLAQDRQRRFALDQAGLLRLCFVRLGEAGSALVFSCHHAILDGWSSMVLINKTHEIYLALLQGQQRAWPEQRGYQLAQRHVQGASAAHADYWRAALQEAPVQNRLSALIKPGQQDSVDLKTYKYVSAPAILQHRYSGAPLAALRALCLQQGVTVNALFEFLCHQILHLYSYEPLTITGATVSGRDLPIDGMEEAVGMLINTLPLVTHHAEIAELEAGAAVRLLQQQIGSVNGKSATYLASLQKEGRRIFDLLFVHNNFTTLGAGPQFDCLRIRHLRTIEKLDYPLAMIVDEGGHDIAVAIRYAGELFEPALVAGFFDLMDRMLAQMVAQPSTLVRDLTGRPDSFAAVPVPVQAKPPQQSIVSHFERRAAIHPERIALRHGAQALSYGGLNARANGLAAYLRERHAAAPEAMIPVCFADPVLDIVAMLAVLKLGGAYVPVAAGVSVAQAAFTVADTGAPFVLTQACCADRFTPHFARAEAVVAIDGLDLPAGVDHPASAPASSALCCVMYTSGSTGQPKGVMIEHAGVVSLVREAGYIDITADDVFVHLADRRFDASLFEVWGALLNGAKLVLVGDPLALLGDVAGLAGLIEREAVTTLWLTKSLFDELYRQCEQLFKPLSWLLIGGEALNRVLVEKLLASDARPRHLLNGYGPTENTTFSTVCDLTLDKLRQSRAVPIGRPLRQRQALVLGRALQALPVGAIGELYVGGAGLARGYLNHPALSAQVFMGERQRGARLYRTGDLAQLSAGGELVFMGRADNQVKLRGYRIELEELELAISAFPGVAQAAAAIKTGANGHKQLIGYYLASAGASIDTERLREHLSQCCPDFMQPAMLMALAAMPLTASGKVNRDELPDPAAARAPVQAVPGPQNELRTALQTGIRRIWATVLGLEEARLGADADFFALGGDSILCLQMVGALNKQYRKNLSVRLVFKHKTVAALAEYLEHAVPDGYVKLRKIWSEVLGRPASGIGDQDDFFAIGGDSILCLQMVNRINKEMQQKVAARIVFQHKTIAALHAWIEQAERARALPEPAPAAPASAATVVALHPIQQWFFALRAPQPQHWNQSFLIHTPELEPERLRHALAALYAAHGVFTLGYRDGPNGAEPFHAGQAAALAPSVIDVSGLSAAALQQQLTALQSGFHLARGPLASAAYLHGYADGSARVFMAFHHLIMDAVSWRIVLGDLETLYGGGTLAPASASYADWTAAVQAYAGRNAAERAYWEAVLADYDAAPYRALATASTGRNSFRLDAGMTSALLHKSNQAFNTGINDLLVAALALALRDLTAREAHHVVIEGHGREHIDEAIDVSRTVGWFTILRPLRVSAGAALADTIKDAKENLRAAPLNGLGYGALFGYERAAMPAVSFNYLGQFHEGGADGWYLADEAAGLNFHADNVNGNLIDINCYVKAGQLAVDIDSQLAPPAALRFAGALATRLAEVIDFCRMRQSTEYSASDFLAIGSAADLDQLPAIDSGDPHDWFEMTEIQKAYLLGRLASFEIGNVANHIYYEFAFDEIDNARLQQALDTLIAREPVLRTVFSFERMQQRIVPLAQFGGHRIAHNDHGAGAADSGALEAVRQRLSHVVYDPRTAPLFTFETSRLRDRACLHISMDLILLDAESRRRLLDELDQLYRRPAQALALAHGRAVTSFKHYQAAYQALRMSPWYRRDRAYWQDRVREMPLRPELPLRMAPGELERPLFADHTLYVEPDTWRKFKEQAARYGVSPSAALLSLYGEVIGFHAGGSEFIMTMTVFNRYPMFDDVERIMGDFTSTNLFHFKSSGKDALQTIERSHQLMWDNIAHGLYTGLEVQRDLVKLHNLDPHKATSPIVFTGVLGNKNGAHERGAFLNDGERHAQRLWMGQTSQAWIDLQAIEVGDRFMSKWLYVDQLFGREQIAQMNMAYCKLIAYLAEHDWNDCSAAMPRIAPRQQELIAQLNHRPQAVPQQPLFALIAASERVAVIDGDGASTSYRDLLSQAGDLARHLWRQACGAAAAPVHSGKLAAILCEKGAGQVIAALAAMQAGHGYLPLNVDWPLARLKAVLDEGRVTQLLVSRAQAADAALMAELGAQCRITVIDDVLAAMRAGAADAGAVRALALPQVLASDIAYVIFTSGSTGTPKGVTISHHGALNTILAVNRHFEVAPADKVLALSELSFDLSVYDIFGLLIAGGTVVFPEQSRVKDMAGWVDLVERHQITLWNTVPQLASLLAEEYRLQRRCNASLRAFLLSGDRIAPGLPAQLRERFAQASVTSLGGATEGSIWSIWHPIGDVDPAWNSIPYGTAMPNQSMLVLNPHGAPCPLGVTGEIHIGGAGVALNYWGDAAKSAASFIDHAREGRLYKTGDLGRWLPDGSIEFIGRKDSQVKIRGYRVELGDIEACLRQLDGVDEAVLSVATTGAGTGRLIAYVKPARRLRVADEQLAFKLAQHGDRVVGQTGLARLPLSGPDSAWTHWPQLTRKSYRVFDGAALRRQQLLAALAAPGFAAGPARLDLDAVSASLHGLLALPASGAALPKYRYPSAGTLYPVQLYLTVGTDVPGLPTGHYYVDRRLHHLVRLADAAPARGGAPLELLLVGTPAAIEPVYGNGSDFLSLLECGYIEGVLARAATAGAMRWERAGCGVQAGPAPAGLGLAEGQRVLGRLLPCATVNPAAVKPASATANAVAPCHLYVRRDQVQELAPGWYSVDGHGLTAQPWPHLPDPVALDDNAMAWNGAALAVFFVSAGAHAAATDYLEAGAAAQRLMEQLLEADTGTCAMGEVHPQQRAVLETIFGARAVIHHFIAGSISVEQKQANAASNLDRAGGFVRHVERQLQARLPPYMVPERFVLLEQFPLSANGKVDHAALLAQGAAGAAGHKARQLPVTQVEIALARLWSEMLGIEQHTISVADHFFRLGGNSLLAMQFISRVGREFDYTLKLDELYQYPDLKSLSIRLEAANADSVNRFSGEL